MIGGHLLLRDFVSCSIVFMHVCVITVAMVMLLKDFGVYVFSLYISWLVIICC